MPLPGSSVGVAEGVSVGVGSGVGSAEDCGASLVAVGADVGPLFCARRLELTFHVKSVSFRFAVAGFM